MTWSGLNYFRAGAPKKALINSKDDNTKKYAYKGSGDKYLTRYISALFFIKT